MGFLRDNWAWIVVPILLVLAAVVALVLLSAGGEGDFVYPIF
jgi:hypothetical protein